MKRVFAKKNFMACLDWEEEDNIAKKISDELVIFVNFYGGILGNFGFASYT